jgi:hypothetical protein
MPLIIIIRRCTICKIIHELCSPFDYLFHPLILRFLGGLDRRNTLLLARRNKIRDMIGAILNRIRIVGANTRLRCPDVEIIREISARYAVEGAGSLGCVLIREGLASATVYLDAGATLERSSEFETRGVDDEVEGVLDIVSFDPSFGNGLDTLAVRVDKMDVGSIETLEVFVAEARSFSEGRVPRFENFGRFGVLDQLVDTRTDAFLFLEISNGHELHHLLRILGHGSSISSACRAI